MEAEDLPSVNDEDTWYTLNIFLFNWTSSSSPSFQVEVWEDDGGFPIGAGDDALGGFVVHFNDANCTQYTTDIGDAKVKMRFGAL